MADKKKEEEAEKTPAESVAAAVTDDGKIVPTGKTPGFDETIPGGKYETADGRLVNAEGKEIDSKGNVKDEK